MPIDKILRKVEGARLRMALRSAGVPDAWKIFSFTTRGELLMLYELAKMCPEGSVVLEIGSYLGKSSCYLAAGLKRKKGHLFCVDTWDNETMPDGIRDTFTEFQNNTRGAAKYISSLRKNSNELTSDDLPQKASLVFVDGDHSYSAVRSDVEVVQTLVTDDGIIAFHDSTTFEGVSAMIGELLASRRWMLGGLCESLCWIRRANFTPKSWLS